MGGGAQPRLRGGGDQLAQYRDPFLHVEPLQAADLPPGLRGHVAELAAVHGDERGLAEREVGVPAQQGVDRGRRVRRCHDPPAALVEQPLADAQQHLR
jgi:hypothetical protein